VIRAYPSSACVRAGERVRLHVSTNAPRFYVRFVRWGSRLEALPFERRWCKGEAALPKSAGEPWNWPAYDFDIGQHCRSGVYVAVLETDAQQADPDTYLDARSARALFVVRSNISNSPLLVALPIFTYHAYNVANVNGTLKQGEGECLYSGAPWVSLHRPGGGIGGHPWDEVNTDTYDRSSPRQTFAHWDAKAIAWLETHGYAYDCATDLELHDPRFDLSGYRAIASFGHHEYWTQSMRDRVDAFVCGDGNVAFFGGNTCWFRAEFDPAKQAIRRAGRWTDLPEWRTTGVSYAHGGGKWIGPRPPSGYVVRDARHWIFRGSNLENGDTFGAEARLLGYECDGVHPESDIERLADASLKHWPVADGSGEVTDSGRATLGIRSANGGSVFTASTVDWARVLFAGDPAVARITANVLDRFTAKGI
jgi:hypothetical protein